MFFKKIVLYRFSNRIMVVQAELADAIEESEKKLEAFADPQVAEDRESHRLNLCTLSITHVASTKLGIFLKLFMNKSKV